MLKNRHASSVPVLFFRLYAVRQEERPGAGSYAARSFLFVKELEYYRMSRRVNESKEMKSMTEATTRR